VIERAKASPERFGALLLGDPSATPTERGSADAADVVVAAIADDYVAISGTPVDGLDALDAVRRLRAPTDECKDHGYDYDAENYPAPRNATGRRRSALVRILIGSLAIAGGLLRVLVRSLAVSIRLRGILVSLRAGGGGCVGIGLGAVRV
jgi:hypothetical protein